MKKFRNIASASGLLALAFGLSGCAGFDYYPQHEEHVSASDNSKAGQSGYYGGEDETHPVQLLDGTNTNPTTMSHKAAYVSPKADTSPTVSIGTPQWQQNENWQTRAYGGSISAWGDADNSVNHVGR